MQTDVYIKIINEKMNIKILVCWILVGPAIIAFGFMQRVFDRFLEESEDNKKTFRNNLTFSKNTLESLSVNYSKGLNDDYFCLIIIEHILASILERCENY